MIQYPESLREILIKLAESIEDSLAAHSLRLGRLEEKDKDRKKLLKRFLEVTDDLEGDKARKEAIDRILEATKGPDIKAFYYCDPSEEFTKKEVDFVDESIAEEQIELHGTRNIFEGRDALADVGVQGDPACFKCSGNCVGCFLYMSCPLQDDKEDSLSVCASCKSNERCHS